MELTITQCVFLTLGALLVLNIKRFQDAYSSSLARLPGPWHVHLSNLRLKIAAITGERHSYIHSLHQQYGPIVRLAPNEISACDPEAFKVIYNVRTGFTKTDWYKRSVNDPNPALFTMEDPKHHAQRRKLLGRGFQKGNLRRDWESTVLDLTKLAIKGMQNENKAAGEVDILKWWTFLATDVAGSAMFGESFHMLETGQKSKFMRIIEQTLIGNSLASEMPLLKIIAPYVPVESFRDLFGGKAYVWEYAKRAIVNAKDPGRSSSRNIFATIIAETDKDSPQLTDQMLMEEAANLTVAGSDTTGITMTYLVWAVIQRPQLQAALEAEVGALAEDELTDEAVESLPLVNAIIMETLRLYGAAPSSLFRLVPAGGSTLCGHPIPAGTIVSSQAWTLARMKEVWGSRADEFDHTRWLNEEDISDEIMAAWKPFGGDPRSCLGIHLAWMELRLGVALFFREFKGATLAPSTTAASMEVENYFLNKPKSHRCMVRLSE